MAVLTNELVRLTLQHYEDKFERHGSTPLGVDWNGPGAQRLQFEQLVKVLPAQTSDLLVNDLGCGYGAMADYLLEAGFHGRYAGCDVNPRMVDAASTRFQQRAGVSFHTADQPPDIADYGFASGVFTLRLDRTDAQCFEGLTRGLDALDRTSRAGFAFNCLTSYSDAHRMQDYLYYPDPCTVFDWCKRKYARNVALLHDYDVYGFTVLVRKRFAAAP